MKVSEFKKEMKCGLVACLCAMFPLTGFGQRSVDLDINTPTPLYDNINDLCRCVPRRVIMRASLRYLCSWSLMPTPTRRRPA